LSSNDGVGYFFAFHKSLSQFGFIDIQYITFANDRVDHKSLFLFFIVNPYSNLNFSFAMKNAYFKLMLVWAIALAWGCGNGKNEGHTNDNDTAATTTTEETDEQTFDQYQTAYRLPSPIELYVFLKENKAKFDKGLLNSADNQVKYNTQKDKAINFGIYASDLAYTTVFEQAQQTLFYFKTAKSLAAELGLTEGFDDKMVQRMESNLQNVDSLREISADAYYDAIQYFESEKKMDIYSYIVIGSWIESAHIAIHSAGEFSADNKIVMRIADQQHVLDNLMDHLKSVGGKEEQLLELEKKLMEIQESFNKMAINEGTLITKEQFNEIETKIHALRDELIGTNM